MKHINYTFLFNLLLITTTAQTMNDDPIFTKMQNLCTESINNPKVLLFGVGIGFMSGIILCAMLQENEKTTNYTSSPCNSTTNAPFQDEEQYSTVETPIKDKINNPCIPDESKEDLLRMCRYSQPE